MRFVDVLDSQQAVEEEGEVRIFCEPRELADSILANIYDLLPPSVL